MKKNIILLLILVAAVLITGCTTTYTASNGKLAYGDVRGSDAGSFQATKSYMYLIHPELLTFGPKTWESLETMIDPELDKAGANAAKDLSITDGFTTTDFILTYLTGGFLGFSHLSVSGTAVKQ